jgi:hypothetical protein
MEWINEPGQLKKGDKIIIVRKNGMAQKERVKEVLNAGTEKEEIIYNKKRNYYFITKLMLDGKSHVERCRKD